MARSIFTGEQVQRNPSALSAKFIIPPFTVFNAREGDWQSRKQAWIDMGIKSELGRGEALTWDGEVGEDVDHYRNKKVAEAKSYNTGGPGTLAGEFKKRKRLDSSPGGSAMPAMDYSKRERGRGDGKPLHPAIPGRGKSANPSERNVYGNFGNTADKLYAGKEVENKAGQTGTSIFDPVITELFYRWYTPHNGIILDPFAGGSVRGIVASVLGRGYVGIDLRPEQIAANRQQAKDILGNKYAYPTWIEGDSQNIKKLTNEEYDAWFTCPPYFDLEQYSDNEHDLSTMSQEDFEDAYFKIIKRSTSLLKEDSFAGIVVGDVRNKKGRYRGLPWMTVDYFEQAGLDLYNQGILVTAVGSLPLRVQRQFKVSGKLGSTHQYVFIFVKGDEKKAWEKTEMKGLIDAESV